MTELPIWKLPLLLLLIVFVGIPLWLKGVITGTQEGRMMDFFGWLLDDDGSRRARKHKR